MIEVVLNGRRRQAPDGSTAADVLTSIAGSKDSGGAAIAINGQVVPRSDWTQALLNDGDAVEVVTAVQGG